MKPEFYSHSTPAGRSLGACKALIVLTIVLLVLPAGAQRYLGVSPTHSGGPLSELQAAYDVTFYDLALSIHPEKKFISGTLSMTATAGDSLQKIELDLDTTFTVSEIFCNLADQKKTPADFKLAGGKLWVSPKAEILPGQTFRCSISYSGHPREAPRPPWVGGFTWASTADGQPWIATSVQNDGADLWWPCKDHPSDEPDSMALAFTVPAPLLAVSSGRQGRIVENADNTRTFHWFVSTPINNYGMAVNIAPFRTIESTYKSVTGEEIPITFWILPEDYQKGLKLMPQIKEHLAFFENMLGPYPFRADKYGIAQTPFLGMEHQTIIAYGATFENGTRGYDILHHHELGHEWWGNLVSASDWRDFWLHEGLCSYAHPLYMEHLRGREAYHQTMRQTLPRLRNRQPVAPRESRTTVEQYFVAPDYLESDGDVFNKGTWILHSLRHLIGEENFFRLLRRFAYPTEEMERVSDGSQCRLVTSDEFIALAEKVSGRKLDWFFEVYLRQPKLPVLKESRSETVLQLHWETPGNLPFPMPVDVLVDGELQTVSFDGQNRGVISLSPDSEIDVDPDLWVLREIPDAANFIREKYSKD